MGAKRIIPATIATLPPVATGDRGDGERVPVHVGVVRRRTARTGDRQHEHGVLVGRHPVVHGHRSVVLDHHLTARTHPVGHVGQRPVTGAVTAHQTVDERAPSRPSSRSRPPPPLSRSFPANPVTRSLPPEPNNRFAPARADQRVVAHPAAQILDVGADVVALTPGAVVGPVPDRQPQRRRPRHVGDDVPTRPARHHIGTSPPRNRSSPAPPTPRRRRGRPQPVIPRPAPHHVIARAAPQQIIARPPHQHVVAAIHRTTRRPRPHRAAGHPHPARRSRHHPPYPSTRPHPAYRVIVHSGTAGAAAPGLSAHRRDTGQHPRHHHQRDHPAANPPHRAHSRFHLQPRNPLDGPTPRPSPITQMSAANGLQPLPTTRVSHPLAPNATSSART